MIELYELIWNYLFFYLGIFSLIYNLSGTQLGGWWGGLPCPFLKIEKSAMILEKKVLIVFIFVLNFPFEM